MFDKNSSNYLDLTRFIGIYLVVLGHFGFFHDDAYIGTMIYAFHMPLFFIVSGILHRKETDKKKALGHYFYSLLIPYFIYNFICVLYLFIVKGELSYSVENWLDVFVFAKTQVAGTTWFFVTLFLVKTLSLFLDEEKSYLGIGLSGLCILILFMLNTYLPSAPNLFTYKSALMSFPFYVFGVYLGRWLPISIKPMYKAFYVLLAIVLCYFGAVYVGGLNIAAAKYENIIYAYLMAIILSVGVIFFSQLVFPYVKCNFIKDMSRGSMIIVGLHTFILYAIFHDKFWGVHSVKFNLIYSVLLFLAFYPIIKLTYSSLPLLYGKKRTKK